MAMKWWFESEKEGSMEKISKPGKYSGYSKKKYDSYIVTSRYIEVRDGTKLAADIYRPAIDGVWSGRTEKSYGGIYSGACWSW
jgi:predicted acyl esterase